MISEPDKPRFKSCGTSWLCDWTSHLTHCVLGSLEYCELNRYEPAVVEGSFLLGVPCTKESIGVVTSLITKNKTLKKMALLSNFLTFLHWEIGIFRCVTLF